MNLLVSVRSVAEAEAALAGGAGLIDVKEPNNGALGFAGVEVIAAVLRAVAGRRPVSAALGEFSRERPASADLSFRESVLWHGLLTVPPATTEGLLGRADQGDLLGP